MALIFDVVVVGSFMTDVVSYVERIPRAGETVTGQSLVICCGGKGANQCVTAARLGAKCAMIGKLGKDGFGQQHLTALQTEGIDATHVTLTDNALTGVGQLTVQKNGQNTVVTVSGANAELTVDDIKDARTTIGGARVMLCELQIEKEPAIAALEIAQQNGVFTITNAAPANPDLDEKFFSLSDIFCVNETEAEVTIGKPVRNLDEAVVAARALIDRGCKNHVLITLGEQGALLLSRESIDNPVHILAPKVQAVDTAGAGDCFLGALAYFLSCHAGVSLNTAIERSCVIASESVQKQGTQPSFPYRHGLDQSLFE